MGISRIDNLAMSTIYTPITFVLEVYSDTLSFMVKAWASAHFISSTMTTLVSTISRLCVASLVFTIIRPCMAFWLATLGDLARWNTHGQMKLVVLQSPGFTNSGRGFVVLSFSDGLCTCLITRLFSTSNKVPSNLATRLGAVAGYSTITGAITI